jgi:hypothetical protein
MIDAPALEQPDRRFQLGDEDAIGDGADSLARE